MKALLSSALLLGLLAPALVASHAQPIAAAAAALAAGPSCGIVPWTGTCACTLPGRVVPFQRYAAWLRAANAHQAEAVLRLELRACRLPDSRASAGAPPPQG